MINLCPFRICQFHIQSLTKCFNDNKNYDFLPCNMSKEKQRLVRECEERKTETVEILIKNLQQRAKLGVLCPWDPNKGCSFSPGKRQIQTNIAKFPSVRTPSPALPHFTSPSFLNTIRIRSHNLGSDGSFSSFTSYPAHLD